MANIKNSSGSGRNQGDMSRGPSRQQSQQSGRDDREHGGSRKSQHPQSGRTHRSQQR
jgi:hypothetical protein